MKHLWKENRKHCKSAESRSGLHLRQEINSFNFYFSGIYSSDNSSGSLCNFLSKIEFHQKHIKEDICAFNITYNGTLFF